MPGELTILFYICGITLYKNNLKMSFFSHEKKVKYPYDN